MAEQKISPEITFIGRFTGLVRIVSEPQKACDGKKKKKKKKEKNMWISGNSLRAEKRPVILNTIIGGGGIIGGKRGSPREFLKK